MHHICPPLNIPCLIHILKRNVCWRASFLNGLFISVLSELGLFRGAYLQRTSAALYKIRSCTVKVVWRLLQLSRQLEYCLESIS